MTAQRAGGSADRRVTVNSHLSFEIAWEYKRPNFLLLEETKLLYVEIRISISNRKVLNEVIYPFVVSFVLPISLIFIPFEKETYYIQA